jgi:hypothetical protein
MSFDRKMLEEVIYRLRELEAEQAGARLRE